MNNNKLQINVTNQLVRMGMNVRHKGYYYFRIGILITIEYIRRGEHPLCKRLYDQIAKRCNSNYKCVARAMTYALRWAYKHGNERELNLVLGDEEPRPTPSTAIIIIAQNICTNTQTDL